MRLNDLNPKLRERIERQIREDDSSRAIQSKKPERKAALGGEIPGDAKGLQSRRHSICIIGLRRRVLDSDNFIGGCKAVRDAVARKLRVDDADRFIDWEYHQAETKGDEGLIVVITEL